MTCLICPCCGSFIRIQNDEGVCNYCMTFVSGDIITKDPNFDEKEED